MNNTRCTAIKRDGSPCRAWAVRGTDPPRCAAHGGLSARVPVASAPVLSAPDPDARPEDIDAILRDLALKHAEVSEYIDRNLARLDIRTFIQLLRLHTQTANSLGSLLRARRALTSLPDIDTALKFARYERALQRQLSASYARLERRQRQRNGDQVLPPIELTLSGDLLERDESD